MSDIEDELETIEEQNEAEDVENQQNNDDDDDNEQPNDDEVEEEPAKKVIKPKRIIKNPRVKLNAETLKTPKGLTAIPALFARQKFKGHGHEESDLKVLMKTYEYWCHRMFPKYPFDECIEKLEQLGTKKPVITLIKKIRLGMVVEEEPVKDKEDSDEEDEQEKEKTQETETINDTLFDALLDRPKPVELTEEQLEQIRINKENAIRKRQERLKQIQEMAASKLQTSNSLPVQMEVDEQNKEVESMKNGEEAASNSEDENNSKKSDDDVQIETSNKQFSDDDDDVIVKPKKKMIKQFSDSEEEVLQKDQSEVALNSSDSKEVSNEIDLNEDSIEMDEVALNSSGSKQASNEEKLSDDVDLNEDSQEASKEIALNSSNSEEVSNDVQFSDDIDLNEVSQEVGKEMNSKQFNNEVSDDVNEDSYEAVEEMDCD